MEVFAETHSEEVVAMWELSVEDFDNVSGGFSFSAQVGFGLPGIPPVVLGGGFEISLF
jgi:hypothetical protein